MVYSFAQSGPAALTGNWRGIGRPKRKQGTGSAKIQFVGQTSNLWTGHEPEGRGLKDKFKKDTCGIMEELTNLKIE